MIDEKSGLPSLPKKPDDKGGGGGTGPFGGDFGI